MLNRVSSRIHSTDKATYQELGQRREHSGEYRDFQDSPNRFEMHTLSAPNSKAREYARALLYLNGADETRTRDLRRDRPAF